MRSFGEWEVIAVYSNLICWRMCQSLKTCNQYMQLPKQIVVTFSLALSWEGGDTGVLCSCSNSSWASSFSSHISGCDILCHPPLVRFLEKITSKYEEKTFLFAKQHFDKIEQERLLCGIQTSVLIFPATRETYHNESARHGRQTGINIWQIADVSGVNSHLSI